MPTADDSSEHDDGDPLHEAWLADIETDPWIDLIRSVAIARDEHDRAQAWLLERARRRGEAANTQETDVPAWARREAAELWDRFAALDDAPKHRTHTTKRSRVVVADPGETARVTFAHGLGLDRATGGPIGAHLLEAKRVDAAAWSALVLAWSSAPGRRKGSKSHALVSKGHWPLIVEAVRVAFGLRGVELAAVRARWIRWKNKARKVLH